MKSFTYSILHLGIFIFIFIQAGNCQPYVEGGNTRHRFAQSYVGTQVRFFPSAGSSISPSIKDLSELENVMQSSITIGGTHFWGHVDFFINIPIISWSSTTYRPRVETGAKVYPWRIESGKIRPFLGAHWMPSRLKTEGGAPAEKHEFPIIGGLSYLQGNYLWEIQGGYSVSKNIAYYSGINQINQIQTNPIQISLGVKWLFDSTLSAEKDWKSGRTKIITDTLAKLGRLDSWTIGIGPSSAFFLTDSDHIRDNTPFMHQYKLNSIFPDFGLGYYWHKPDIQLNIAFRTIRNVKDGEGWKQKASRRSLSFEGYKFLADYHGFVPFIGPYISREWLSLEESRPDGTMDTYNTQLWRPGITFGWDIRPNRLQSFYLRTNLRWIPNLKLSTYNGKELNFAQLEFNFIQAVFLLNRIL
jgi:hypothetical protein